jgi:hypothetical protein
MLSQPRKDWSTLSSSARQLSSRGLDKMLDRMLTSTTGAMGDPCICAHKR